MLCISAPGLPRNEEKNEVRPLDRGTYRLEKPWGRVQVLVPLSPDSWPCPQVLAVDRSSTARGFTPDPPRSRPIFSLWDVCCQTVQVTTQWD